MKIVFAFTHWGMQSKARRLIADGYRVVNIERKTFLYYGYFAKDQIKILQEKNEILPLELAK